MAGRKNSSSSWNGIASIVLGPLLAVIFYGILSVAPLPLLQRYFMGHPVAYAATILFGVALVGLAFRWLEATVQLSTIGGLSDADVKPQPDGDETLAERTAKWLNHLGQLPRGARSCQLVQRIEEVLHRQRRRDTVKFLNDDLREVSDRDADASHDSIQLVRIIIWAIPMLGFLGTVIGITQTLGGLDFTDATNAVDKLKAGLYVAFDTTALGLVLSVIAIFLQFPVEKKLNALLSLLDQRAIEILSGALPEDARASDEPLEAIAEMNLAVLASVNQLVEKQAELWKSTVDSAHNHWASVVGMAGDQVQSALTAAMDTALHSHAEHIDKTQRQAAIEIEGRWHQWQIALSENARLLTVQQQQLSEQNELLSNSGDRALELAEIRRLMQDNAEGLSSMPEMSDAMMSLARAIDTLVARVPTTPIAQGRAA